MATHTFVICAYRESPYLEECIQSLLSQDEAGSRIILATGTPNEKIEYFAQKYHIPLYVNPRGSLGLGADWNFALSCADSELVTLAHQDDVYLPGYRSAIMNALEYCSLPLIIFTDYGERRESGDVYNNRLLKVKRMLLHPLERRVNWKSIFWRRRALSLGSAICCPSVTLCKANLSQPIFSNDMRSNIDWAAWERISKQSGEFAYIAKPLILHRIYAGSTTSAVLSDHGRKEEDLKVLSKFWPDWMAQLIEYFYQNGEKSNEDLQ